MYKTVYFMRFLVRTMNKKPHIKSYVRCLNLGLLLYSFYLLLCLEFIAIT